jgi:hypothetical protein
MVSDFVSFVVESLVLVVDGVAPNKSALRNFSVSASCWCDYMEVNCFFKQR